MQSVSRVLASVVSRGRIGRKRSFAVAIVGALLVMPVATALAYFSATGSGQITGVTAGSPTATAQVQQQSTPAPVYKDATGAAATALYPGGSVAVDTHLVCTANPPCSIGSVTLSSWSADAGHAGCTSTAFPNSFSIASQSATFPAQPSGVVGSPGFTFVDDVITITWANLAVDQSPCAGASFTYNLTIP